MANFSGGDNRKLGKILPRHQLMRSLLSDFPQKPLKITKATQTECRLQAQNAAKKQIFTPEAKSTDKKECYRTEQVDYCSCSDSWSDASGPEMENVVFPKETRNAMEMLKRSKTASRSKKGAWPGFAERRVMNAEDVVPRVTNRLSKNKL